MFAVAPGRRPTIDSAGGDPFPFAWGTAELLLMGGPLLVFTILAAALPPPWPYFGLPLAVALGLTSISFLSTPPRAPRAGPVGFAGRRNGRRNHAVGARRFCGGPAVRIGIFLSIFNVHLNRSPLAARVIALRFSRRVPQRLAAGNRLAERNMWIALEEDAPPTGGWSCGRFPGRSPGGSFATCGRAK